MPTYVRFNYPLPAINAEWLNIDTTTTRNSAWVPMTAIPRPSTTFFCYWDSTMELTLKRLYASIATSLWDVTAYLQLANAAGTGIISFPIGVSGFSNHDSGNALANMSKQNTWLAAVGSLTQARVQITLSRSNFYSGCDVTVDVAAGTLQVYSEC